MDQAMMQIIHNNCEKVKTKKQHEFELQKLRKQKSLLEVTTGIFVASLMAIILCEIFL